MKPRSFTLLVIAICSLLVPIAARPLNLVEYIIIVTADFHQTERAITNIAAPGTLGLHDGSDALSCRADPNVRYVLFNPDGLPIRGEARLLEEEVSFVFQDIGWNWLPQSSQDGRLGSIVANGQDLGETRIDALGRLKLVARLHVECACADRTSCTNARGGGIYQPGSLVITQSTISENGQTVGQSVTHSQPNQFQIISPGNR